MKKNLVFTLFSICVAGCGVRGDPVPPRTPPELGYGKPINTEAVGNASPPYVPLTDEEVDAKKKKK